MAAKRKSTRKRPAKGKIRAPRGAGGALTRKFGPLPAWAWLAIFALAVYYYRQKTSAAADGSATQAQTPDNAFRGPFGYQGPPGAITAPIVIPGPAPGRTRHRHKHKHNRKHHPRGGDGTAGSGARGRGRWKRQTSLPHAGGGRHRGKAKSGSGGGEHHHASGGGHRGKAKSGSGGGEHHHASGGGHRRH